MMGQSLSAGRPQNAAFQRALAALRTNRVIDAENLLKEALRADRRDVAALNLLAIVLMQLGRFAEAETYLHRALQEQPKSDATLCNYGIALKALNRPAEALERFSQAAAINANVAETWNNRGTIFNDLKRYDEAIADFGKAIGLNPRYAEAFCNKANSYVALEQFDDALPEYKRALELKPDLAEAWCGCGGAYWNLKRHEEASAAYDRALKLKPNFVEAWLGHGNASAELKRYDEACAAYDKALALKPDLANAWLGRGNVFTELKRYDEAFAAYDKALSIKPDLASAWLGCGNVFSHFKRHDKAFAAYDKALALEPDLADAWFGRGNVLHDLNRHDEASAAYDKALSIKPDLEGAWHGRGNVFMHFKRYDEAIAAYDKALALNPDLNYAAAARMHAKLQLCDWTNLKEEAGQLLSISGDRVASAPFLLLGIPSSPSDLLQCTRRYVKELPRFAPLWRGEIYSHDRIRVAYLSADFREHPVAYLTAGLFEQHDRSQFEVTGISFGSDDSPIRERVKAALGHFIEVGDKTDQDIAEWIRRSEIDIVVDLMGHTQHSRFSVFARRSAPIQVNYLGFAGTTGADCIDYILAESTIIPAEHRRFYAEHVAWLPSYQPNDDKRQISERTPSRAECGLPNDGFVFSCFNSSFKIMPEMFDIWMRLLQAVDGSVLWLGGYNKTAADNLRREADRRGVTAKRLIFAEHMPQIADHLARLRQADLFLDTLPYNAHTTASEALWAGLPVITCIGSAFPGRVAGSVLKSAGLDELVTTSLEEYETLALKIARDRALLATLKAKLAASRDNCLLFDTGRFTRNIERAYTTMVETHRRGEPPRNFSVE